MTSKFNRYFRRTIIGLEESKGEGEMKRKLILVLTVAVLFLLAVSPVLAYVPPMVQPTPYFTIVYGWVLVPRPSGIGFMKAPLGTCIEIITPRGEVAGVGYVGGVYNIKGLLPFTDAYGGDPTATPPIPGFRTGEKLRFRVNSKSAWYVTPSLGKVYWTNDWDIHEVRIYQSR